jgi:hypothetical protein
VQRLEEVIHQSIALPGERQALTNQSQRLAQLLAPPWSRLPTLS